MTKSTLLGAPAKDIRPKIFRRMQGMTVASCKTQPGRYLAGVLSSGWCPGSRSPGGWWLAGQACGFGDRRLVLQYVLAVVCLD